MAKKNNTIQASHVTEKGSKPWSLICPPFLYLGPCSAASSAECLAREGITHILSIGKTPKEHFPSITYERISLTDEPDSLIAPCVTIAARFIDAVRAKGSCKVFVHCSAAISRSPTVLVGYLMQREGMTLHQALSRVILLRPTVHPNPGFIEQLKQMEMEIFGVETLAVDRLPLSRDEKLSLFSVNTVSRSSTVTDDT